MALDLDSGSELAFSNDSDTADVNLPSDVQQSDDAADPEVSEDDVMMEGPGSDGDSDSFQFSPSEDGFESEPTVSESVPSVSEIELKGMSAFNFAAMEIYSPPRVLPMIDRCPCPMSLDILTGWNLLDAKVKQAVIKMWETQEVKMLLLSPPCAIFSPLQVCFRNYEKMDPEKLKQKWAEGLHHLDLSVLGVRCQLRKGGKFMLEHPQRASSWSHPPIVGIRNCPGVFCADFDQCMLDLKAPNVLRMKKRTRVMTNCSWLASILAQYQCDRSHVHQPIEGSMAGHSLSWWAQRYPPNFSRILAESATRSMRAPG
eukprot:Skav211192  [mRNA]  locus=scaffold2111:699:1640:- [translate_table: standard]